VKRAVVLAGTVGLFAACGPSFQAVYEGDVRFEHCYALDENAASDMRLKADCWRDWMKNYTYGQTRDRVEYAAARHYALSIAPNSPSDEALMEAAPGGGIRKNVITAPMPTSVYAPPPNTIPVEVDGGAKEPPKDVPKEPPKDASKRAPGFECGDACSGAWSTCKDGCTGKTCELCDATYRACMSDCFKALPPAKKK
jgi:hypothetical protein